MNKKSVIYCTIGTILEWYEFSIFVYLTPIITKLFFVTSSATTLIATFGVFAVGFVARPLGGIFFGHLGDTLGRKSTLVITIFLMASSTTIIGILPNGTLLGLIGLIICRLFQGFATSGEYPGGMALLSEQPSDLYRGFMSSCATFATGAGMVLGALVYIILTAVFSSSEVLAYAWRIPFLLSAPIGIFGYFIRRNLVESREFEEYNQNLQQKSLPLKAVFATHGRTLWLTLLLFIAPNILIYLNIAYLGNQAMVLHKITSGALTYLNFIIAIVYASSILLFGFLSTRYSAVTMLGSNLVLTTLLAPLLIYLAISGDIYVQLGAQTVIAVLLGATVGLLSGLCPRVFPVGVRYTGLSLMINLSASFFGGSAPLLCALFNKLHYGQALIIAYVIGAYVCALFAFSKIKMQLLTTLRC